ncbi:hypothetical protein KCG43_09730 [Photobacterium sp. WH24]|uniref:hypothetical protein n=1 Tax=Photobacterium sp. WH24 TaxID=2827237 RepID=UPI001C44BD93|nr:hypothetical protein [Photobacterium sp. WH24]MBV7262277.1 hypothetical protein [Photobacterium sp. WH24]
MRNFLFLLMVFSPTVLAECNPTGCIGIGKEALLSVYPNHTGHIYLQAPAGKEKLNCKLVEGQFMVLKNTHPVFDAMYSTVLTALSTQKQLTVRIVENSEDCEVSYVRMFM